MKHVFAAAHMLSADTYTRISYRIHRRKIVLSSMYEIFYRGRVRIYWFISIGCRQNKHTSAYSF